MFYWLRGSLSFTERGDTVWNWKRRHVQSFDQLCENDKKLKNDCTHNHSVHKVFGFECSWLLNLHAGFYSVLSFLWSKCKSMFIKFNERFHDFHRLFSTPYFLGILQAILFQYWGHYWKLSFDSMFKHTYRMQSKWQFKTIENSQLWGKSIQHCTVSCWRKLNEALLRTVQKGKTWFK